MNKEHLLILINYYGPFQLLCFQVYVKTPRIAQLSAQMAYWNFQRKFMFPAICQKYDLIEIQVKIYELKFLTFFFSLLELYTGKPQIHTAIF